MIPTGHWAIQTAVTTALTQYQSAASAWTAQIFGDAPAAVQSQLAATLGDPAQPITVELGYPTQQAPVAPSVWIMGMPGQELREQSVLGNLNAPATGSTPDTWQFAAQMSWALDCVAVNAHLSLGLSTLVVWALWSQRPALLQQLGAQDLHVSWGTWEPLPTSAQDGTWPYKRTVMLTAAVWPTWTTPTPTTVTRVAPGTVTDLTGGV